MQEEGQRRDFCSQVCDMHTSRGQVALSGQINKEKTINFKAKCGKRGGNHELSEKPQAVAAIRSIR